MKSWQAISSSPTLHALRSAYPPCRAAHWWKWTGCWSYRASPAAVPSGTRELTSPAKISAATLARLARLGIRHRADLLLHLPLRYEDETHLVPIENAEPGETVQVQGVVTHSEIIFKPRRTLLCRLHDTSGELYLRFLNFYPSQQKLLAVDKKIRAIGEVRAGFYGLEMVHPKCRAVDDETPLQTSLTPVYPTTAGLSQTSLRKLIANALEVLPAPDYLPEKFLRQLNF